MKFNQQLHVFSSGMRLVFIKTPDYYTARFKLVVEVGSEDEKKEAGLAHLIEHSVFKGTDKLNQEEISARFNALSADIDASTSSEFTSFKSNFPKRNLTEVLSLISHILSSSVFDERELEKEKQVIIEEILMHEDIPEQLAFDNLVKTMFKDVGIGFDIAGEIKELQRVSKKEVKDFFKSHYKPENFLISVIGDYEFGDVIKVVETYFEKAFSGTKPTLKKWSKQSKTKPRVIETKKEINQANILIGFKTVPYESLERVKIGLIGFILGGSMSSRLFEKIRNEMSLVYSIYAFDMNYKNNGFLGIALQTSAGNKERAIFAVNEEISRVLAEGVTDEEFMVAKNLTLDKYLMNNDNPGVALSYLSYTGKLFNQDEMVNLIKNLSKQEAEEAFKKYVSIEKEFVSIVAP